MTQFLPPFRPPLIIIQTRKTTFFQQFEKTPFINYILFGISVWQWTIQTNNFNPNTSLNIIKTTMWLPMVTKE